jgi:hypothetical protein
VLQNRTRNQIGTSPPVPTQAALALGPKTTNPFSSRTRVTELPNIPRYRFFSRTRRRMAHATFRQGNIPRASASLSGAGRRDFSPRLRAPAPGQHARAAARRSVRELLLPVFGIAAAWRLREDVRNQKKCASLVGHELREASPAHAARRFPRRPAVPASSPRRTRTTSEIVLTLRFPIGHLRWAAWYGSPALRGRSRGCSCQRWPFPYPPNLAWTEWARFSNP